MGFENRGEARWNFEGLQFDCGLRYLFLYSKYHLYGFFLSLRNILTCFPFLWRFFELTPAISNDSGIGSGCYFLVCISPQREKSVGVEGYNISQVLQWHLTSLFWLVVSSLSVYFLFRICEIDSLPNLITTSSVSIKISLPHPSSILKP
jgi:hypothetical protein